MPARMVVAVLALVASCDVTARAPNDRPRSSPIPSAGPLEPSAEVLAELRDHRLAFMDGWNIVVARGDGTDRHAVARVPGAYGGPSWSTRADAFVIRTERQRGDELLGLVIRVDLDGSETVNLSARTGSTSDAMVAWAPSGRRIAFISTREGDDVPQLYVMDAEGRSVRRVRRTPFEAQYPAWSPDGERIAFTGVTDGSNFDLYVVDADGTDLRRLTRTPTPENWPTWAPESDALAYSIEDEIWVVEDDGSDLRRLTPEGVSAGEPSWSPDGGWVAFDCSSDDPVICAIRPDGTDLVRLFQGGSFPVWID